MESCTKSTKALLPKQTELESQGSQTQNENDVLEISIVSLKDQYETAGHSTARLSKTSNGNVSIHRAMKADNHQNSSGAAAAEAATN